MRLNDTIKAMLLAGVIASPALAQQTTTDPAAPAMPGQAIPERVAPATPPAAAPTTPAMPSQGMPAAPREIDPVAVASGMRASKVVGATVRNSERESIGSIDDLIITRDAHVTVAVISVGGFLGIGAKLVAVPFERLQIDREGNVMLPNATRESLRDLPAFKYPA